MTGIGEGMEKLEATYIAVEIVKWGSHLENNLAVLENFKHRVAIGPSNSTQE